MAGGWLAEPVLIAGGRGSRALVAGSELLPARSARPIRPPRVPHAVAKRPARARLWVHRYRAGIGQLELLAPAAVRALARRIHEAVAESARCDRTHVWAVRPLSFSPATEKPHRDGHDGGAGRHAFHRDCGPFHLLFRAAAELGSPR